MRVKRMGCPNDGLGHLNDAWGGGANFNEERVIFRYVKSIFGLGASKGPFGGPRQGADSCVFLRILAYLAY